MLIEVYADDNKVIKNKIKTFCKCCNSNKKVEEMVSNKIYGPGYKYLCKKCDALQSKNRRDKNKEKTRQNNKLVYVRHRNKILLDKKRYYLSNKERISSYSKQYWKSKKIELREKQRSGEKRRLKTDFVFALKKRLSRNISRYVKNSKFRRKTRTWQMLGTDRKGLIIHFKQTQNIDILNLESLKGMSLDHICPLSQAKNDQEIILLNHYSNLQLLPLKDNITKSNKKTDRGIKMCLLLLGREWEDK